MWLQNLIIKLVVMTMQPCPSWLEDISTQRVNSVWGQGERFPKVQITFSFWKLGFLKNLNSF
jgi:hypothetical protein